MTFTDLYEMTKGHTILYVFSLEIKLIIQFIEESNLCFLKTEKYKKDYLMVNGVEIRAYDII